MVLPLIAAPCFLRESPVSLFELLEMMYDLLASHRKRSSPIAFWLRIHNADPAAGCRRTSQYSPQWLWFRCFIFWPYRQICLLTFRIDDLRSKRTCQKSHWDQEFRRDHILDDREVYGWTTCTWEWRVWCIFFAVSQFCWLCLVVVLITVSITIVDIDCLTFTRYCYWRNNGSTSYNHSIALKLSMIFNICTNLCVSRKKIN